MGLAVSEAVWGNESRTEIVCSFESAPLIKVRGGAPPANWGRHHKCGLHAGKLMPAVSINLQTASVKLWARKLATRCSCAERGHHCIKAKPGSEARFGTLCVEPVRLAPNRGKSWTNSHIRSSGSSRGCATHDGLAAVLRSESRFSSSLGTYAESTLRRL